MQITKQADYAVRAVLFLAAQQDDERSPTNRIALEEKIPPSFLAKIISQLSVAGVVNTSRGAHGGVSLARPAAEISLLEVVEAIDGPITLNDCVIDPDSCAFGDHCPVHDIWVQAQQELVARLENTHFDSLADRYKQKSSN